MLEIPPALFDKVAGINVADVADEDGDEVVVVVKGLRTGATVLDDVVGKGVVEVVVTAAGARVKESVAGALVSSSSSVVAVVAMTRTGVETLVVSSSSSSVVVVGSGRRPTNAAFSPHYLLCCPDGSLTGNGCCRCPHACHNNYAVVCGARQGCKSCISSQHIIRLSLAAAGPCSQRRTLSLPFLEDESGVAPAASLMSVLHHLLRSVFALLFPR